MHPFRSQKIQKFVQSHLCLEDEELNLFLVPPQVAVLSVVGAFRSGKSFLLTFFLRYLRHGSVDDPSLNWMTADGSPSSLFPSFPPHLLSGAKLKEGNRNDKSKDDLNEEPQHDGFAWAGGQNRQTTGIWMWSEPFIRKVASYPEPIAILLMDTQGMFDNETTMALTARIFGLSTLISSYQVCPTSSRAASNSDRSTMSTREFKRIICNIWLYFQSMEEWPLGRMLKSHLHPRNLLLFPLLLWLLKDLMNPEKLW
jgi:atlastin